MKTRINQIIGALGALALANGPLTAMASTAPDLEDLTPGQRQQLRCTMLAGAILYDYDRGVAEEAHGITETKLEEMGTALAASLDNALGLDQAGTRALLKAEFELFSFEAAEAEGGWSTDQIAACSAHWNAPAPIPVPPTYTGKPVTPELCHAIFYAFAEATAGPAGQENEISATFFRRGMRIGEDLLERAGEDDAARATAAHDIITAMENFDATEFDALPEVEAETIMQWCEKIAGPDE